MSGGEHRSPKRARRSIGSPSRGFLAALASGRCPRCRDGKVFRGRWAMHVVCPSCGLCFDREPGYFTGAMYVSYGLALPLLAMLLLAVRWTTPGRSIEWSMAVAALLFLPFVPLVFRTSRIIWIHLDRSIDPS